MSALLMCRPTYSACVIVHVFRDSNPWSWYCPCHALLAELQELETTTGTSQTMRWIRSNHMLYGETTISHWGTWTYFDTFLLTFSQPLENQRCGGLCESLSKDKNILSCYLTYKLPRSVWQIMNCGPWEIVILGHSSVDEVQEEASWPSGQSRERRVSHSSPLCLWFFGRVWKLHEPVPQFTLVFTYFCVCLHANSRTMSSSMTSQRKECYRKPAKWH